VDSPKKVKGWVGNKDFADANSGYITIFGGGGGQFRGNWQLYPSKLSVYHGPNKGKGASKWVNTDGREIVISAEGKFETRTQYMGTYNFGKNLRTNHKPLDITPWEERGKRNSPYD
jgi:hypothetical protein